MLLRSSSTPILGSLLTDSCGEGVTPNHHFKKVLYPHHVGSLNFNKFSCSSSSPSSPSVSEFSSGKLSRNGFRKVMSEGNLEGLAVHESGNGEDEFSLAIPLKKFPRVNGLETIPSFSLHGSGSCEDEESDEDEELEAIDGVVNQGLKAEMSLKVAERREMCLIGEAMVVHGGGDDPTGGCGATGGGGGGGCKPVAFPRGGGDSHGFSMEEYFKKMVDENPSNPLFLRNYAHFLHQTKGDCKGAEEYYSRAILADPGDGEVLSQYANLVWELHRDADRATSYFERAVQAAAEDRFVFDGCPSDKTKCVNIQSHLHSLLLDFPAMFMLHMQGFSGKLKTMRMKKMTYQVMHI
nr:Tetratricopeptide-like helical [Ipomoea batatas]